MKKMIFAAAAMAAVALAGSAQAAQGLNGRYFNFNNGSNAANEAAAALNTPFATFTANNVCFPDCTYQNSISDGATLAQFLGVAGGHASNLSANQSGVATHTLVLDGFLRIQTAGLYNFFLSSDDGSFLRINGTNVINNDGLHGPNNVGGSATLAAGFHAIRILQWENGGGTNLQVRIQANGAQTSSVLGGEFLATAVPVGAVPEPATWAMMIVGFGASGVLLRRRREATATA